MLLEIRPGALRITRIHSSPEFPMKPGAWNWALDAKNPEARKIGVGILRTIHKDLWFKGK